MAEYSPVASGLTLKATAEAGYLGGYLLLISSQVNEHPEQYEWLRDYKGLMVMDNSVIEKGAADDLEAVRMAARTVGTRLIVLPDVLNDGDATIQAVERALVGNHNGDWMYVGVAQGQTAAEIVQCSKALGMMGADVIALPRCITDNPDIRTRVWLTTEMRPGKPVILLGMSKNLSDDCQAARRPNVIGIDSATPVWYGRQGTILPAPSKSSYFNPGKRPEGFWEDHSTPPHVFANIIRMQAWAR